MQKQENVYVETESAEQGTKGVVAREVVAGEIGSAALGKFKDVNALFEAYKSLQAEFTRRSQRLKRLEEEAEKRAALEAEAGKTAEAVAEAETEAGNTAEVTIGGDDGPKTEVARPDLGVEESVATDAEESQENPEQAENVSGEEKAVKADMGGAFAQTEGTALTGVQTDEEVAQNTAVGFSQEAWREARVFSQRTSGQNGAAISYQNANDPETLYQRASADESVRLRIVGDYLSSIQKGGAPLMQGGTQAMPIGRTRAGTIVEAGRQALMWLREKGNEK